MQRTKKIPSSSTYRRFRPAGGRPALNNKAGGHDDLPAEQYLTQNIKYLFAVVWLPNVK